MCRREIIQKSIETKTIMKYRAHQYINGAIACKNSQAHIRDVPFCTKLEERKLKLKQNASCWLHLEKIDKEKGEGAEMNV